MARTTTVKPAIPTASSGTHSTRTSRVMEQVLQIATTRPEVRSIWRRYPVGSVELRTRYGIWPCPHYAYGVYAAAEEAAALGINHISVAELGVAGGNGLLALEEICRVLGDHFDMEIVVWGFDSGAGMPEPRDYRDLPHVWEQGFYKMDVAQLQKRIGPSTRLVIGDVSTTIPETILDMDRLGFIAFDLDYYSSTVAAFSIFDGPTMTRLPRIYCYFDDTIFPEWACHNDGVGELLAISEFNERGDGRKIHPVHMLRWIRLHAEPWNEQMYVMHDFGHPDYPRNLTRFRGAATQYGLR